MKIVLILFLLLSAIPSDGWQIATNEGPPPRYINQLASTQNSLVLFGGKHSSNKGYNDIWEWKDGKWKRLGAAGIKRWDHSLVYMETLEAIFLYGGRSFQYVQGKEERVDLNDNWVYKKGQWKALAIDSPAPRSSHSMAYFEKGQQVILFGGRNKTEVFGDTWSFDGTKWSRLALNGPRKRYGHSLTYDPKSKAVHLFGGFDGDQLLNDHWIFEGEEWVELKPSIKPAPRMAHAMQFDSEGNAALFGGWDDSNQVSGELWIWTGEKWAKPQTGKSPPARLSAAMGYDPSLDAFFLFGGSTGFGEGFLSETWKLTLPPIEDP